MKETGVNLHTYEEAEAYLSRISVESLLLNPAKTNYTMYSAVNPDCRIIHGASPVTLLKAIRNEQEIAGIHAAMQRDGVALVKFLKWLEASVPTGKETEISIDKKLHEFRAEQDLYMGESFDTIAGYKEHGAIVHYEATPETDVQLKPEGFAIGFRGTISGWNNRYHTYHCFRKTDRRRKDRLYIDTEGAHCTGNGCIPCRYTGCATRCAGTYADMAKKNELPAWHRAWCRPLSECTRRTSEYSYE